MRLDKKKLLAIFFLALLVKLVLFAVLLDKMGTFDFTLASQDTEGFIHAARNLYAGRGFSDAAQAPYTPDGVRVPVVALLLGLFGEHTGWYLILQIAAASFTCVLLADLGARFFGKKIGLIAGVVLAVDPLAAFQSQVILSETWFAFFLVLAVWLFAGFLESGRHAALWLLTSAFVLGIATLTRPVGVAVTGVFLLALAFLGQARWLIRLRQVALFAAVVLLAASPWLIRNYRTFGAFGLSYIPAYNWYHFNARVFYARLQGISKADAKAEFYRRAEEEYLRRGFTNEFQMQDFYLRESRAIIAQSPLDYLAFHGVNTAAVLLTGSFEDWRRVFYAHYRDIDITSEVLRGWAGVKSLAEKAPLLFAEKIFLLVCYLVIFIGFLLNVKDPGKFKKFIFLGFLVLVFAATTGAVAEGRFRVPAEPFIVLLFVESVHIFYGALNPRSRERQSGEIPKLVI